ncbi:conserved hypothetical protein [Leishmania major strain Friedlin]|uniref:Uncharacterized protein n=1 Tax=Leishmania major TaxID=5664 RepID=Q4QFZ4_LEIMA|nr:conserved hypothetical protein [Leishmania major strain Friedlin]CAG9571171.1 hypothetical_protein_-_conserved [Leishmania major strain Friedlin]CAJ03178.1 conserved hypothetical protein [Leishmania major strain Friedlin]|eukprot:XP_001681904.1 conserved hypothetical protein [Leishmania major strain Friedlin]
MPNLASVRVTPVLPHGAYESKAPHRTGASYVDVISSTEREVMEQCLQEQLAVVANLVVDQVEQRTGQQLDALHVTYADKMKSFSEIVLNSIHDELRQLRVVRERQGAAERGSPSAAPSHSPMPIDAEAVARLVSARVAEQLTGATLPSSTTPTPPPSSDMAYQLTRLEESTAAHFEDLQRRITAVVASRDAPAVTSAPAELRTAVVEAVQKAAAEQQEKLSNLINDLLAEERLAARGSGGDAAANAIVDMRAIEESIESAVQSATNELRRTITSEVKKLEKSKGTRGEVTAGSATDADMAIEIEKVFDAVQSTQSRLAAVDEVVGDIFKEQAATRDALRVMQEVLQRRLDELRGTVATEATASTPSPAAAPVNGVPEAAQQKITEVLEQLRRDVSATSSMLEIHNDNAQQQLMTVAQVVSDSVTAAIQQHTEEALQSAMTTVQEQLNALREAGEAASAAASAAPPPAAAPPSAPLSQEVLTDAVEAVLSPRWAELSVQVEKMNTANKLAIEQQLLHIADSVSTSVAASLQAQLEEMRTSAESQLKTEHAAKEQGSVSIDTSPAATAALIEKTTHELTTLREELLQALQAQVGKTPEVNLTPMYKYIDSVLTFMKEELSLQETNLTAKMASLAETVTAAVREQQEATASSASLAKLQEGVQAVRESVEAGAAKAAALADVPPPAAPGAALSDIRELLSPMDTALEAHVAALRRLEERLDEVSRTADVSSVLTRLQEASEQFRSASAAAAAAQTAERDTLQVLFQDHFTSLTQSLEGRDARLIEAVRGTATSAEMRAQLSSVQDSIQSTAQAHKEELLTALRESVSGSEKGQTQRTDALLARMVAIQEAVQEQHASVQLLQPSPALIGFSAEQQRAQARIRTATRDRLRRVTQLISDLALVPANKSASAAAEELQNELAGLRQLQEEEAALVRETSTTGTGPVTMQSIVQAEVQRVQEEMQKGIHELSSQGQLLQRDIAAAVQSLVAKIDDVGGNTSGLPSLADIQELLDATMMRIASQQNEEGVRASQLVEAATSRSVVELKTAVQTALVESVSAAEKRLIPSYHAKVESTLRTHLTTHSTEIKTVVNNVADTASAAVQRIESIAQDMASRHTSAVQEHATSQDTLWPHSSSVQPTAHVPLWWLIANPLLVCAMVLFSIYYVFACLLLAFVPKPPAEGNVAGDRVTSAAAMAVATGSEIANSLSKMPRKGGRYVDRYM